MTGTRAPLKIVPTHRTTSSGKMGGVLPADTPAPPKPKLLDQLRESLRSRHYSRRTEQTYCQWVKRFIFFHHVRHPVEMAEPEMNHIYDRNSAFSVGVLYGKYCGVWGFIPIHINIDGSDASRRAIGAADCHPLLSWRFAPVHQAAAAVSLPREQARVYVSR